jgi:hypothetical protein
VPFANSGRQEDRSHAVERGISLAEHFAGSSGDFVLHQDVPGNRGRQGKQLCGLAQVATSIAVDDG